MWDCRLGLFWLHLLAGRWLCCRLFLLLILSCFSTWVLSASSTVLIFVPMSLWSRLRSLGGDPRANDAGEECDDPYHGVIRLLEWVAAEPQRAHRAFRVQLRVFDR